LEALARLYKNAGIDPSQPIRLFLIAPRFSLNLLNRCKWINISEQLYLFTYRCIQLEDSNEILPVYSEITVPSQPQRFTEAPSVDKRLDYITDESIQSLAKGFLSEVTSWKPEAIRIEPIKYAISLKVNNRVFAYFNPRRKAFILSTHNEEGVWTDYRVETAEDLEKVAGVAKANMDRKSG